MTALQWRTGISKQLLNESSKAVAQPNFLAPRSVTREGMNKISRYILWGDSYDILFQIPLTFVQLVEIDSDKLPTVPDFFCTFDVGHY